MVFFSPLSEYTRTFIIKCSLSSILQRTRHKSQETMENVNKAERIVEFFFVIFFFIFIFFEFLQVFFCLCFFLWFFFLFCLFYTRQAFLPAELAGSTFQPGGEGNKKQKKIKIKERETTPWNSCTWILSLPHGKNTCPGELKLLLPPPWGFWGFWGFFGQCQLIMSLLLTP